MQTLKDSGFPVNEKLLSLCWKQPFADLMLHGKIETRSWPTAYRGWVLIVATKYPYKDSQIRNISGPIQYQRICDLREQLQMKTSMAIAIGKLIQCRQMRPEDEDLCFVQYHPDLYCHIYRNVYPIEPIPFKGHVGWNYPGEHIKKKIKILSGPIDTGSDGVLKLDM